MKINVAQHDVQRTFLRGSVGQAISGLIWLLSAALGTWISERHAILLLVLVGIFIFPLTQLTLRLMGRPAGLPKGHPMNQLAARVFYRWRMVYGDCFIGIRGVRANHTSVFQIGSEQSIISRGVTGFAPPRFLSGYQDETSITVLSK